MYKPLLHISAALALAAGLAIVSFGAEATPVNVDLSGCGGSSSCTSGGITFLGWEKQGSAWAAANLTYKADGAGETGLGVACTYGNADKCGQHEINTMPPQYISASLGFGFDSLSLGVGSVDNGGDPGNEEAFIYGSTCANYGDCLIADLLGSYIFNGTDNTHIFTFTAADLSDYTFLYVTPYGGAGPDANILLSSMSYFSVPEPAVRGMFGYGALLVGLFAVLRRRRGDV